MNSLNDSAGLNCSLSGLLESMDDEFEQPFCAGGLTVMTKDSIGSPQKNKSSAKTSKRSSTRKKSKDEGGSAHPLENSLSNLLASGGGDDDKHSSKQHHPNGSTKRRTVQQSPSVETMDSVHKAKGSSPSGDKLKSRRGGKKSTTPTSPSLESSLSNMLNDPDNSDDDVDDNTPKGHRFPRESGTLDSMHKPSKSNASNNTNSSSSRSKRGGRRDIHSNSLALMGGPPPSTGLSLAGALDKLGGKPKDFGRQADDNDTFCGLGTVGEMEMKKVPLSKQSPRKDKVSGKAKVTVVPAFGGTQKKSVAAPVPKAFMMSSMDDDDSDEEEDLFQSFGGNPFRTPYR